MKDVLRSLLTDFLTTLLFLAVYVATGSPPIGAAVAVASGIAQVGFQLRTGRRIAAMQWVNFGLIVTLAGLSTATRDPRFVMLKPSIIHFAVAGAMLQRGWADRYLTETARRYLPPAVPITAGYAWAGLMIALGTANIVIALYADFATWAWFASVVALGAKVAAFLLQYAMFRTLIRRRRAGIAAVPSAAVPSAAATAAAVAIAVVVLAGAGGAGAAGFQQISVPDPQGAPLAVDIWYPSDAAAEALRIGPYQQVVAANAPIAGSRLPLILISHGNGGTALTHYDTAIALATAGFVAAAVEHTGDNWHDRSDSFTARNFVERPRHLRVVLDYLLSTWAGRDRIDPDRIGAFGHSAGGYTVLTAIGGEPDLTRANAFCQEHPEDWGCRQARARAAPPAPMSSPVWIHDPRIKVALIAAPAAGQVFTPASLARVTAPVQLWAGERDKIAPNRWSADAIAASLPTPPEQHVVPLAGHFAFLPPCSADLAQMTPATCDDPPGFDRSAFHRVFNTAVAEFFAKSLNPL